MTTNVEDVAALLQKIAALEASVAENQKLVQNATLEELLEACYTHLDTKFVVETDPTKSTTGSTTSPVGRRCPRTLEKWTDFPASQSRAFGRAYKQLHPRHSDPLRLFKSLKYVLDLSPTVGDRSIASEADLRRFHDRAVEYFVVDLCKSVGHSMRFDNHPHTLGQATNQTPDPKHKIPKADQLCVHKGEDGLGELLLVLEYKAPHKITNDFLRAALKTSQPIDVIAIKDQSIIPTDKADLFLYKARQLVAAAATQAYDYMLQGGCEFSALVTGGAIVFLWISKDKPSALRYYLAEPTLDVGKHKEAGFPDGFPHPRTAIAQLFSLCLMAFSARKRSAKWRRDAVASAATWLINDHEMEYETPKQLHELLPSIDPQDYSFQGDDIEPDPRSPYETRKKWKQSGRSCNNAPELDQDDSESPEEDSDSDADFYDTPTKQPAAKGTQSKQQKQPKPSSSSGRQQRREYCTQACLLGLVRRHPMDKTCPNIKLHPRSTKADTHVLTAPKLCEMLRHQLNENMDNDCVDLRLYGARGMLFQLTLTSYGYTFVGKGTIEQYIPDLQNEHRMYQQLRPLQGNLIPVCLGSIDLDVPWYDLNIEVIHILLMSYGGEAINRAREVEEREQVRQFEMAIAMRGVTHQDIRCLNMLWNKELGRLMFIDFERSTIKIEARALQEIKPNSKRKQQVDEDDMLDSSPAWKKGSNRLVASTVVENERTT
ncbi:MAG: hypothetical protein LQ338_007120 [Usnochroma carphineum]|nr:MAG: hypothetical protein LQ338_007120 [Usnochroma carphineum]